MLGYPEGVLQEQALVTEDQLMKKISLIAILTSIMIMTASVFCFADGGFDLVSSYPENGQTNTSMENLGVKLKFSSDMDSASSQFFICYTDCNSLDGNYAAFGEVTQGMEIVDSFLQVERVTGSDGYPSYPTKPITMETVKMVSKDENGNPRVMILMNDFLGEQNK